mgnify:CR=1 FL=1
MARPSISRSIKRNRLREMECDCTEAGQDFVPSSALFSVAGATLAKAPRQRSKAAPARSKPKSKTRRAA